MGCEGRVNFAMFAARSMELNCVTRGVLFEYFRLAESLKSAVITPTVEYLMSRLDLTERQVRTANKALVKLGWITRQWTVKATVKRTVTTILQFNTFLHDAPVETTVEATPDVDVRSTAVTGVSSDVDVSLGVIETVKEVKESASKTDAQPQVAKAKKPPKKDPPYFRDFLDHIQTTYATLKMVKHPPIPVWQIVKLREFVYRYDAPTMMAWWDETFIDPVCINDGNSITSFLKRFTKLQDSKTYKTRAADYRMRLDCQGESPDPDEVRAQIAKMNIRDIVPAAKPISSPPRRQPQRLSLTVEETPMTPEEMHSITVKTMGSRHRECAMCKPRIPAEVAP